MKRDIAGVTAAVSSMPARALRHERKSMLNRKCVGTRWRCAEGHEWVTSHCDHAWFPVPFKCPECGKYAVAHRGEWKEETVTVLSLFATGSCCSIRDHEVISGWKPRQGGPIGTRSLDEIMALPTAQEMWMEQERYRRNRMQTIVPVQKATPVKKASTPQEVAKFCSRRLEECSELLHKLLARIGA